MFRHFFEKPAAQYATLAVLLSLAAYYFGWIFEFRYKFDWSVLWTVNATYGEVMGMYLVRGLYLTICISLVSAALALGLGVVFGLGRLSHFRPVNLTASAYVEFFRNTPLLVQLFFWYFALPRALPDDLRAQLFNMPVSYELVAATLGLAVYSGSFMAEVIRAGIQSIPKGLLEAAFSSGLSFPQTLRKIVLPLAFRNIMPPLGSEFLNNMKNSSLAMVVGVAELCWSSQQIESLTFRGFEATSAATVIYLSVSLTIAAFLNLVNQRLKILPRKAWGRANWAAYYLFLPLEAAWASLSRAGRRFLHARRESLTLTAAQAARKQLLAAVGKGLAQGGKALFLLALALVVFQALRGVASFKFSVIWDNLPLLLWWRFPEGSPDEIFMGLGGLSFSILMSVISIAASFVIGLFVGVGRTSKNRIFLVPCTLYIELIRGNPLIMVIFWIYFFLPIIFQQFLNVFWSAVIAMTLFTGAYIAEIVRGGIQNIPPGQFEAAFSTGLTYFQTMRKIVLPQALKQMLPAIVGQFIAIFKDTSLAYVIGVLELTFVAQGLNNRLMVHPFEVYTTVAVLYFTCCYAMSAVARRLERRLTTEKFRLQM